MSDDEGGAVDRLSELPESLILHILSLLETREAVKTSLLSKPWVDLWTSIPRLHFNENGNGTLIFVYRVLLLWRGSKILNFKLDLSRGGAGLDASSSYRDVDFCLRFATEKKVEVLEVYLPFDRFNNTSENSPALYRPPQCLYSCSSITELRLSGFDFKLGVGGMKVQWYNLKILYLRGLSFGEDVIDQVVSSAPKLEELALFLYSCGENLNIRSSSLKKLMVSKLNNSGGVYTNLLIWAPKLEELRFLGKAYSRCLLMDVSSLNYAALYFHEVCDLPLAATLFKIRPKIKHVESISLTHCSFKMLQVMFEQKHFQFLSVKTLMFWDGPITPKDIVVHAQIFPNVETLKIGYVKPASWYPWFADVDVESEATKNINVEPLWMQLRRVEVAWYSNNDDYIIDLLIDFLMKHATKVHEINVIQNQGSADMAAAAQFRVQFLQKIFPTEDLSITFSTPRSP